MPLAEYKKKRDFEKTPEPSGAATKKPGKTGGRLRYVVQKHRASRLHYDFRLELDGVLKSWAVPKGPSLDPKVKRLAMMTEDHPLGYASFEGEIPKGNYGAGQVIVWDTGSYQSAEPFGIAQGHKDLKAGLRQGRIDFVLFGRKLKGRFVLIKAKGKMGGRGNVWLLIKHKDRYASLRDVTKDNSSVISGRTL